MGGADKLLLNDLTKMSGLDTNKKVKLVRHQDNQFDTEKLYREGRLEHYQSIQSKNVFGNCDYIVSFLGHERTQATFIGIYQVTLPRFYGHTERVRK